MPSLAIDSRAVAPGALFAALPGSHADGRAFIGDALARGAGSLLLPAEATPPPDVPCLLCARPREAAGRAAQLLAGDPTRRLRLLGVTGTNGKSTCVHLLQWLLDEPGAPWGRLGTLAFAAGAAARPSTHTTPDPVALAALLAESVADGRAGVAMEVSSHALDQDRVAGCRFAGVLATNLSRDHLDYHGTLEAYFAAKARLLDLRAPGAPALLNADDPWFARLLAGGATGEGPRLGYGRGAGADYRCEPLASGLAGSRFRLHGPGGAREFASPLPGAFNLDNAAGCLALALALGAGADDLAGRLACFPGVPGRLERVELAGGPAAVVDYAHTPDAVAKVLAALRPLCRGSLVVVLGAGGDRDRGKRPLMGAAAQRGADRVWLTSDNPRGEDPAAILAEMEKGMDPAAGSWQKEVDRARAIGAALAACGPEDLIAVLGKGHEEYQEIDGRRRSFSDREVLRAAWRERGGSA
ncbi:MAG: UDP-N-acetylmuramoyl-L-alanyl-D-glutamate--2,6-diaminopimelate ligase [Candidatus Krumholzibacteriota bacterium]|nr:UDP-N-acetylmuramoyl-L-alanyl-D-glutamate--2,6-diaminopimelate ligase [Candidatus Krumholzibacteriota bacterium]